MNVSEFVGWLVAVDCGPDTQYVGTVKSVDTNAKAITLKDALLNGETLGHDTKIASNRILDLNVLELNSQGKPQANASQGKKLAAVNGKGKNISKENNSEKKIKANANAKNEKQKEKIVKKTNDKVLNETNDVLNNATGSANLSGAPLPVIKLLKRGDKVPASLLNVVHSADKTVPEKEAEKPKESVDAANIVTATEAKKPKKNKILPAPSESLNINGGSSVPTAAMKAQKKVLPTTVTVQPTPQLSSPPSSNNGPTGIRINPLSLISSLASVSLNSSAAESQTKDTNPQSSICSSSVTVAGTPTTDLKYQRYGEFKSFKGKQKPVPCSLDGDLGSSHASSRRGGRGATVSPSGVPIMDFSNGYGKVHKRNRDLGDPINYNEMEQDFDFDGNLALFAREEVNDTEESDDANSEAPAHVRNYRYDENIVQDVTRVTSWTSSMESALPVKHMSLFDTIENRKVPVLDDCTKVAFLTLAKNKLGSEAYHMRVADRIFNLFLHILDLYSLRVTGSVVILGSNQIHAALLQNLSAYLSNRRIQTTLVDCNVKTPLPHVESIAAKNLQSIKNVQFVINLDATAAESLNLTWLVRVANSRRPAYVIDLECERPGFTFAHTLYLGAVNESMLAVEKQDNRLNRFVADIGVPFTWFEKEAADALADLFSKGLIAEV